jgi:hypothetical protein
MKGTVNLRVNSRQFAVENSALTKPQPFDLHAFPDRHGFFREKDFSTRSAGYRASMLENITEL